LFKDLPAQENQRIQEAIDVTPVEDYTTKDEIVSSESANQNDANTATSSYRDHHSRHAKINRNDNVTIQNVATVKHKK
jgi:hypothetical protein